VASSACVVDHPAEYEGASYYDVSQSSGFGASRTESGSRRSCGDRGATLRSAGAILPNLWAILGSRRMPSKRALAAFAKLLGRRLERRWPFFPKAHGVGLNLGFDDVLEFQYARRRSFFVMVVGAYDGVENDPVSTFVQAHACEGIFVEPQPHAFARLRGNLGANPRFRLVNAAIDHRTGTQEMFYVPPGIAGIPQWTGQLASFRREHVAKHEDRVPGLSAHVRSEVVRTVSFEDLLDQFGIAAIDVLQVDAEGVDAMLLSWFPFERIKPGVVHYEIAHMSTGELDATRTRLKGFGYRLYQIESPTDEVAVLI
jgi:FkbM family methyltransferase